MEGGAWWRAALGGAFLGRMLTTKFLHRGDDAPGTPLGPDDVVRVGDECRLRYPTLQFIAAGHASWVACGVNHGAVGRKVSEVTGDSTSATAWRRPPPDVVLAFLAEGERQALVRIRQCVEEVADAARERAMLAAARGGYVPDLPRADGRRIRETVWAALRAALRDLVPGLDG